MIPRTRRSSKRAAKPAPTRKKTPTAPDPATAPKAKEYDVVDHVIETRGGRYEITLDPRTDEFHDGMLSTGESVFRFVKGNEVLIIYKPVLAWSRTTRHVLEQPRAFVPPADSTARSSS